MFEENTRSIARGPSRQWRKMAGYRLEAGNRHQVTPLPSVGANASPVKCDGCCVGCFVAEDLFGKCGAPAQLGVQADPPSREVRSTPTDTKPMVECDFEGNKGTNAPELPPFGEDGPGVERRASEVGSDAHGLHRVCPTRCDPGSQSEVERARATVHPHAWSRKRRFISRFEPSAELCYARHQEH